jgi:carbamoyltransferase
MRILGLSAFYRDSAAALVKDGCIIAAAQEERFTRKKHDAGFPSRAIQYCLKEGSIGLGAVDHVATCGASRLRALPKMASAASWAPRSRSW